ncbi:salicylate hydroxylase [Xylariaceae sp. FL0594]|nr:salicylate hydroxylase [Xylariaceae sp. FL0594]
MATDRFRVAIIGGGLAGATLANALLRLLQLDVHIFESAAKFSERGAAILSTGTPADLLKSAGAVRTNTSRILLGSGSEVKSVIMDLAEIDPGYTVARESLLRELLAPLPESSLHANKRLDAIKTGAKGVELSFKDGSVDLFDAVIGADGIFGSVRTHVLGDQAADVVTLAQAEESLTDEYFKTHRQWAWVGQGAFIMHDPLDNGTKVQCVVSAVEKDPGTDPKDRKRPLTREVLKETLKEWPDSPIAKGMIDLMLLDHEDPATYSQWEHKATPTYAKQRVCIIGDAAHATTPWQGAGVGLAFEDAVVLAALLEKVRRPRCQDIIDSSRGTGLILCGQSGLEVDKLKGLLAPRWSTLYGLDLGGHKKEALEKMRELQGKN